MISATGARAVGNADRTGRRSCTANRSARLLAGVARLVEAFEVYSVLQLQPGFGHEEPRVDGVRNCLILFNPLCSFRVPSGQQDSQEGDLREADLAR